MWIFDIIQLAIILAISIWMHEYAHAYVSYRLGDPTPKLQWRLTPNPLKHIDPVWFLMIFLVHFWRGKPVQINPLYYKNPLKGELMVAFAGPAMNMILAIIWILVILIYAKIMGGTPNDIFLNNVDLMISFWINFSFLNIAFAIFNLIPIFPLDGYRLVKIFWRKLSDKMESFPMYSFIGLIIVLILLFQTGILSIVSQFIFNILFTLLWQVFY